MSEATMTKTLGCAQTRRRYGAMRSSKQRLVGEELGMVPMKGRPEVALACGDAVFDRAADC